MKAIQARNEAKSQISNLLNMPAREVQWWSDLSVVDKTNILLIAQIGNVNIKDYIRRDWNSLDYTVKFAVLNAIKKMRQWADYLRVQP